MHNDNPLRQSLWNGRRTGEAWAEIEAVAASVAKPVRFFTVQMDWGIPQALGSDVDAWAAYHWVGVADLARAAGELAVVATGEFLAAREPFLIAGRFLPATSMARAALEHAVVLDHVADALVSPALDWLRSGVAPTEEFPVEVILPLWKTVFGGRYDWDLEGPVPPEVLRRAEKRLLQGQRATNILTLLERSEVACGRPGLVQVHAKLCDCVHPSRGSREVLYDGVLVDGHQELGRLYTAAAPTEIARLHRANDLVAPAVHHIAAMIRRYRDEYVPTVERLTTQARKELTKRGYDPEFLARQARIQPTRGKPSDER